MNTDSLFSFMTDPPSLEQILRNDHYQSVRSAAARLQERLASNRKASDSVLTASRTLVETVCKTLLTLLDVEYDDKTDLQDLSKKLLMALDLHPSTQTVKAMKQTCQGAINMINGIACLRNAHGDAHGREEDESEVLPFPHAEVAAYLSFALTRFFILSFEARISRKTQAELSQDEETILVEIWLEVGRKHRITNPDKLPYSKCLEEIAQSFTHRTSIVLPRRDIYLLLQNLRKAKKLPKPKIEI
jgi:hypothetical protein